MITDNGKLRIKEFLPGGGTYLAASMVVGVGQAAETSTDSMLQFETARVDIDVIQYDNVAQLLVFKGTLEADTVGTFYEVGLFTEAANSVAASYGSRMLTEFDSQLEQWSLAVWDGTNARIGIEALAHSPAASSTQTSIMSTNYDLAGYSGADTFTLALYNGNTNASSCTFRFKTDASNYYYFTLANPIAGYVITPFLKSSALQVGAPNWNSITGIEMVTVSKASGTSSIWYDGIRVEDTDSINPEYAMVARKVSPSPIIKVSGLAKEIEYGIPIAI